MFFRLLPTAKRKSDLQLLIRSQTDCYITKNVDKKLKESTRFFNILTGVKENVLRRLYFYASDFGDGIKDWKSFSKVVSSSVFLFFLCILPCVAFGVLNSKNTDDKLNADRALIGQAVGGFLFSVMSGQPFVIIATTAPMSLCTRIIFMLSQSLGVEFYSLYALVGLFNCFFLVLYGLLGMSTVITFSRRCVEEIFLIFSFVCFLNDAFADAYHLFFVDDGESCNMACRLLFLLLLLLTSFICHVMYNFKFSRFGNSLIRDLVSDYAVPLSVVVFSLIGYFIKSSILVEYYMLTGKVDLQIASFDGLWDTQILVLAVLLGFAISLLFFMDQGISAQLVNTPMHGLKKGNANDYDLVVVGIINILTSLFGLPFMHGLLPHSPLHVHSLADWEERLMDDTGIVKRVIVQVRETRLATIFCHILISLTVVFCPQVFSEIPVAVLDGLFLYCAFACLRDNSFFDRLLLLVTQKSKYPPSHYIRTCPQDKVHLFTGIELVLTVFLVYIGFSPLPLLKIFFPVIIAFLIPIRHLLLRKVIGSKFVKALDSY
jgi:sodium borate transporter 11